jgi:hypothetical protein
MSRGIDDVLARYPDDWNRNWFANFACEAADWRKGAGIIGDRPWIPEAWPDRASFDACKMLGNQQQVPVPPAQ